LKAWLDGELIDADRAVISIADKGFLVGDGVFETLRAYDGRLFALDQHLDRLARSAQAMKIELPEAATLREAVLQTVAANELGEARVRITVTSGVGPAGLDRADGLGTALVTATPLASPPAAVHAAMAPWPRNERSILVGVKTTSNAENVAKLAYARGQGADEALSVNLAGNVCEGASSNVFVVQDGRVLTPPLSAGCLAGITRERLIVLCGQVRVEVSEEDFPASTLTTCDEIFITSSTREVVPVTQLDGRPIGDGNAGTLTQRLAREFSAMVRRELG